MHEATAYILDHADALRAEVEPSERLGRLTDRTVEILRASGGMRLLQSKDDGGLEAHPNDFMDWVMAVGLHHPSAGWVAGVVGIHPWEIAIADPRLQKEVYADDPEVWIASPYAPIGRAVPVDGGYLFSGRWPYSTGTDHSRWVILGGMVAGPDGVPVQPPDVRHFVLPRSDYEVLEDTWNVMGLAGTGSKDVQMTEAFVPDHRVLDGVLVRDNTYSDRWRPGNPLYAMRFGVMFPFAISAGTFGIARAAVQAARDHIGGRISSQGSVAKADPFVLAALAVAESDTEAGISHVQSTIASFYDTVSQGGDITVSDRLRFRVDQVRATDRAITAVNELYRLMGSSSIQKSSALEKVWRDLQVCSTHVCNSREPCYLAWGLESFGGEVPPVRPVLTEAADDPTVDRARARVSLAVVVAAAVVIGLNATMLNVALPSVVAGLGATSVQGTWMLLSYLVVSGGGLVAGGQLADSLDPGRVFRVGLGTFVTASLALAVINHPLAFIVARGVQGGGAALLLSSAAAIIAIGHPAESRRWAMGLYLAGFSIAQVSGPMIGGALTSTLGWRSQFVVSTALGAVALVVGWRPMGRLRASTVRGLRLDVVGNTLILVMITLCLVAFAGAQRLGWTDARTLLPLLVVALLAPMFLVIENRVRWPAVSVDLVRDPDFVLANLAGFCLCVARIVPALVLSLWFQGFVGDSPMVAAAKITPLAAAVTVGTLLVGRVGRDVDDLSVARTCAVGSVVGSSLILAAVLLSDAMALLVPGLVVTGLATGGFQTVNSTMILGMRPLAQAATVNGIRTTAQQAGVSLGTALLVSLGAGGLAESDATAFFAGRAGDLDATARAALREGYATSLGVLVLLCVVGTTASLALSRRGARGGAATLISAPYPL